METTICRGWGIPAAYCDDDADGPGIGFDWHGLRRQYKALTGALNAYPEVDRAIRRMIAAGDVEALRSWDMDAIYNIGYQTSGHDHDAAREYTENVRQALSALADLISARLDFISNKLDCGDYTARTVWRHIYQHPWDDIGPEELRDAASN